MRNNVKNLFNKEYSICGFILVYMLLTVVGQTVFAQSKCSSVFQTTPFDSLIDRGYDQEIARKIFKNIPELANKIANSPKEKSAALTLFRGLDQPPNAISFDLSMMKDSSEVWFTMNQTLASSFARSEYYKTGTIIEVQIPIYFFESSSGSANKDPAYLESVGATEGTVSRYDILNMEPFVRRIGVKVSSHGADQDGINWITYEDAIKVGFFKKNFSYKKYFESRQ